MSVMFTSKTKQNLVYSLRLKPMLTAMEPGDVIDIPAIKTTRMNVWTAANRLNKAAGWKEYTSESITDERGKKIYRVSRHTPPADWVGTLINQLEGNEK